MRSGLLLLLTLAVSTAWARKAATAAPPSRQHHHSAASLALKRHPTTEVRFNATFATAMSGGLYNITRIREDVSQVLCRGDVTNSTPPFLSTMRFEHHFGLGAQLNNFLYRIMQLNLRAENLGWPSLELERLRLTWSSHGEIVDGTRCPSKTHRCLFRDYYREHCPADVAAEDKAMALAARTAAMRRLIHNSSRYAVTGVFFEALYSPNGWLGARIDELDAALARSFGSGGGAELAVHVRRGDKLKERLAQEAITLLSPLEIAALVNTTASARGLQRVAVLAEPPFNVTELAELLDLRRAAVLDSTQMAFPVYTSVDAASSRRLLMAVVDPDAFLPAPPTEDGGWAQREPGAFLFATLWSLSRARSIVINSKSNLGGLLAALAVVRSQGGGAPGGPPDIADMDGALETSELAAGRYFCRVDWGPRRGLC